MPISDRLAELGTIVEKGGRLAQAIRGSAIARELKADGSIVTAADRGVETQFREELRRLVPGSEVWGEEFGYSEAGPQGLWVVDPVDGTSNFSFGGPLWGVSAALVQANDIVLGAVHLPDLNEIYLAEKGGGAYLNGQPLPPIPPGPIQPFELVSYSDHILRNHPAQLIPGKMRLSGSFVVEGTFFAAQRWRGLIGFREHLYDIAACVLMAQELGADVRYADGSEFRIDALAAQPVKTKPWIMFPGDSGFFL